MKTGMELITEERNEHLSKHRKTIAYDIIHNANEQLAMGAEMLLAVSHEEGIDPASYPDGWDENICSKMIGKPYRERLIIVGSLIAAELDRLNGEGS